MSEQEVPEAARANTAAMNTQAMGDYASTFTEDALWEDDAFGAAVVGRADVADDGLVLYDLPGPALQGETGICQWRPDRRLLAGHWHPPRATSGGSRRRGDGWTTTRAPSCRYGTARSPTSGHTWTPASSCGSSGCCLRTIRPGSLRSATGLAAGSDMTVWMPPERADAVLPPKMAPLPERGALIRTSRPQILFPRGLSVPFRLQAQEDRARAPGRQGA